MILTNRPLLIRRYISLLNIEQEAFLSVHRTLSTMMCPILVMERPESFKKAVAGTTPMEGGGVRG